MFDIGWQELFIVAVLALIVVGPKDLPQAIRTITTWIRKARMMARDFQSGVNEMVREAELDQVKDQLTGVNDIKKSLTDAVDPGGEIAKGLVFDEEEPKPGSVPLKNMSDEDMESMSVDGGEVNEAGDPEQFATPPEPDDEDVMPVAAPKSPDKTESKS